MLVLGSTFSYRTELRLSILAACSIESKIAGRDGAFVTVASPPRVAVASAESPPERGAASSAISTEYPFSLSVKSDSFALKALAKLTRESGVCRSFVPTLSTVTRRLSISCQAPF